MDYHFVSKEQFETWIRNDQLIEHAVVYGEYKGIPRPQVEQALAEGKDVVLRIDVQGAATVRKLIPKTVSVFLVRRGRVNCLLCGVGRCLQARSGSNEWTELA